VEIKCLASGSAGNAFIINDGKTSILIEAGIPFKELLRRAGYKLPRFAFISHEHKDHSKTLPDLVRHGVEIFSSEGTLEASGAQNYLGGHYTPMKHRDIVSIGSFNVQAFRTEHDASEPLGAVFASRETGEQVLFATDTYFLRTRFANISHFLIECNFSREDFDPDINDKVIERALESHFSLEDLVIMLKSNDLSKLQKVYLCHLSESNLDFEKARKTIQETTGVPVYLCMKNGGFE
jgi:phosphoribosyl 1,2-cyclic phosphodiesterase